MILSDLLRATVFDDAGARLGRVIDARFALDGQPEAEASLAQARLVGLLVSPHSRGSYLGYERRDLNAPWPIAKLEQWRHRGSFLVLWEDLHSIDDDGVHLRAGFTRHDVRLT
ncbi:MAG TPA: PRC-barrel domain containing protein [Arthrobacter sp.]|nr:PRC-barrel domain containing protein [Arthrobacter sp.]